jgi:hypothetical protein
MAPSRGRRMAGLTSYAGTATSRTRSTTRTRVSAAAAPIRADSGHAFALPAVRDELAFQRTPAGGVRISARRRSTTGPRGMGSRDHSKPAPWRFR